MRFKTFSYIEDSPAVREAICGKTDSFGLISAAVENECKMYSEFRGAVSDPGKNGAYVYFLQIRGIPLDKLLGFARKYHQHSVIWHDNGIFAIVSAEGRVLNTAAADPDRFHILALWLLNEREICGRKIFLCEKRVSRSVNRGYVEQKKGKDASYIYKLKIQMVCEK